MGITIEPVPVPMSALARADTSRSKILVPCDTDSGVSWNSVYIIHEDLLSVECLDPAGVPRGFLSGRPGLRGVTGRKWELRAALWCEVTAQTSGCFCTICPTLQHFKTSLVGCTEKIGL